jgi:hypothetical protein
MESKMQHLPLKGTSDIGKEALRRTMCRALNSRKELKLFVLSEGKRETVEKRH